MRRERETRFAHRSARAGAAWLCLALALAFGAATSLAAVRPPDGAPRDTAAAKRRVYSIKDSPGWHPTADPESAAVRLGRRTNAPLVSVPFHGGAKSLDDLGRRVCRYMHHSARDSMVGLCVRADEFRDILWREFPQSRPATGLRWSDAWNIVGMRLQTGCVGAINENGGRYLEYLRFDQSDTTMRFKNFKLHRGLTLVARDDEGHEQRFDWLRTVAERKGVFKIFAVED